MQDAPQNPERPSVTRWMNEFRTGDDCAAEHLWNFVKAKLTSLARGSIKASVVYDEEDVALEAFAGLCDGLRNGRFNDLENRQSLWSLLAVIALNRARNLARDEQRLRRGGGWQRNDEARVLRNVLSPDATPDAGLMAKEECSRLLGLLKKDELKAVALLKVDGHTNEQIAQTLGCTRRSVQRRLNLIRDIWSNELT